MKHAKENRNLEMPSEVMDDPESLELVSVWYSKGKVKVLTRDGTQLDRRVELWTQIVAAVIDNIAEHVSVVNHSNKLDTIAQMTSILSGSSTK